MKPVTEGNCLVSATNLCVFTVTGRTYSFRNVTDVIDNENCIAFSYTAMSDGRVKKATFYKYNGAIAGVSRF